MPSGESRDGSGRSLRDSFDKLCQDLNMDLESGAEAWENLQRIRLNYTLEGETLHWLACALYVACRKSITPTVSKGTMEGNGVSLTRILRSSKLSLIQFFSKMKKWADMANLCQEFRERVEQLERNFEVSTVIFKKFEPIFLDMFQNRHEDQSRLQRSRKQRRLPCSTSDAFSFCWTLFVYTKGNFRMIGDDLVNSYHLLLCCLDLVFGNALLCPNRKELLNPNFEAGLPPEFNSQDYKPPVQPPCIIDKLCDLHDGLTVEAKGIKEHYWKPYIKKLFERKILKGNSELLVGLLDVNNFTDNNKAINKEYEEYVLTVGDFDERIFLGEDADEEIGTPSKSAVDVSVGKLSARIQVECNLQQHFEKTKSLAPSTPLTGRRYLKEKELVVTPVSSATQSVSRLQTMVMGLKNTPSELLLQVFNSCSRNPVEAITARVKKMGETFCHHYVQPMESQAGSHIDFAIRRLRLAEILYWKILETVMLQENRRNPGKDMTVLLEQDIFHRSLMACCLEIVLSSYSSQRTFPWIIAILDLSPFYFYKVIEVLIRAEDGLSRDMVKHLNNIEEQILESRAWSHDSALWKALFGTDSKVPTCEEVTFPSNFETGNGGPTHLPMMPLSPIVHPRVKEVRTDIAATINKRDIPPPASPLSVHDRFTSPSAGSAKRRLFGDDNALDAHVNIAQNNVSQSPGLRIIQTQSITNENITLSPGQTVVTMATATVTATNGQTLTIPVQGIANETGGITFIPVHMNVSQQSQVAEETVQVPLSAQTLINSSAKQLGIGTAREPQIPINKPKKTGSLALFFRKVYHLASVRLRDLCLKLDVSAELRRKIWTCFEYSLVNCTDLMTDRHLDQLLLCAVYIMAKVTKEDRSFTDIMKCYRSQPQANSSVYRSVLLKGGKWSRMTGLDEHNGEDVIMEDQVLSGDHPKNSIVHYPGKASSPSLSPAKVSKCPVTLQEERGDLIKFYNTVYVNRIKEFALKYSSVKLECGVEAPPLSPFPNVKSHPVSPRRISQRHAVYISPHKNGTSLTPRTAMMYRFNRSPSKNLRDINCMIKQGERLSRKRAFTMESDSESPAKRLCQENDDILLKRLQDVVSERANR
ncbi:retinoblastoma-like protein 1 isoform X1 [Hemiscyllium ocellatum]|uniref:retinoblastoma-like protein 1 isoform X1 n=2 Tax=Hemiscyllium ocellatum TaxID=170820 RepID=UPI002966BB12|nr:retinoblastoma-like protein 1 isoform X1 [Hemiscyllium ocellatum]